jgi:nitrate reductase NapE component
VSYQLRWPRSRRRACRTSALGNSAETNRKAGPPLMLTILLIVILVLLLVGGFGFSRRGRGV